VEVTGARTDLHSGLHGGVLRNPIQALAELCASFHDAEGRVNVPGFYDDVLDVEPWEREQLARFGQSEAQYREFLDIPAFYTPKGFTPFEATRFMPTLEFNGIGGGYQGQGTKTVIPSKAFVKISCRLVANQQPDKIRSLLYAAIAARMPRDVNYRILDQHSGTPYVVVPPDRSNTPAGQSPVLANAFRAADAAIAAVLASVVTESPLTGLGAGGFMLVHTPGGDATLLDFFVSAGGREDVARGAELEPVE
jgi:acetylornithine deacetylase/succinyl-diaminopimelate desuccinylase-like protein